MTCNRPSPYVPIAKFGSHLNPLLSTDPVGYSIYDDIDSYFDIGPNANRYGPNSRISQLYMAEKCSGEWDAACEYASRNNNRNYCNAAKIQSALFSRDTPRGTSIGEILVENSAVRRFCDLSSCAISKEPYNPMDPTSPDVSSYGCNAYEACAPVCKPPTNPDADILLNKVLDAPDVHVDLLLNMYRNSKNDREKYKNTRIGAVFNLFDLYFKLHGRR